MASIPSSNNVEFEEEEDEDEDVYNHLRSVELSFLVNEDYLNGRNICGAMRNEIVDWLAEVCTDFHYSTETYFLTVDLFDRFLQKNEDLATIENIDLIGITAVLIAAKYKEIIVKPRPIEDYVYVYITDDRSVTVEEIRLMEVKMWSSVDFFLGKPTPITFLRRLSKIGQADVMLDSLAKYMIELCSVDYTMCHHRASMLAAAALLFSLHVLDNSGWTDNLTRYSKYAESELTPLVNSMARIVLEAPDANLQEVRNKFSGRSFYCISTLPHLESDLVKKMAAKAQ